MGTGDSLCNYSMGIPSLFPPPGSVGFKVHAHIFLDLLALGSSAIWPAICKGGFCHNNICLEGQNWIKRSLINSKVHMASSTLEYKLDLTEHSERRKALNFFALCEFC